jgi:type III pantothenate kinase
MNLIIDIGNTSTKIALFDGNLQNYFSRFDELTVPILEKLIGEYPEIRKCIVSPAGHFADDIELLLKSKFQYLVIFDHKTPVNVKVCYHTPETLGKDRLAAVVGASNIYEGSDVLVIDLGTAITYDIVNGKGEYLGGNISPGSNTRFKSLYENTDKLPLMKIEDSYQKFGKSTKEAIVSGVMNGIVYEIQGYINNTLKDYPQLITILTGGDHRYFAEKLNSPIFVHENLVLVGLNIILQNSKLQN